MIKNYSQIDNLMSECEVQVEDLIGTIRETRKTRQKIKVMKQRMRLFYRQGIEGLAVRCQKGEGGIAVKNILYLTSEVAKSSLSTSPG